MHIRVATPADAEAIAALIACFHGDMLASPTGEGAEPFLQSVSAQAEADYLASPRYLFLVAEQGSSLAGVIAVRDRSHLFHLFVQRVFQGQGLARSLWVQAQHVLRRPAGSHGYTVNASLRAVPVYRVFGFEALGTVQTVHGVSFQAMRLPGLQA